MYKPFQIYEVDDAHYDDVEEGNLEDKPLFDDLMATKCISPYEDIDVIFHIVDHIETSSTWKTLRI